MIILWSPELTKLLLMKMGCIQFILNAAKPHLLDQMNILGTKR